MGLFRTLAPDDLRAILVGFAAPEYRSHIPIAAGTINTNLAVDTSEGRLFLRVNEGKDELDVRHEAAVLAYVGAAGVPTPQPLSTPSGVPFVVWDGALVSLFPWVEGDTLARAGVQPAHARAVGQALGRLHAGGAGFTLRRRSRYEPDDIARRLAGLGPLAAAHGIEDALATLAPALAALQARRQAPLPEGLIHGDLFVDNVLFDDGGGLAALLDFEQASWGRLAYDVAVTLLAWGFGVDDFQIEVVRALLDGYRTVRAPRPEERAAFADELRFAACRFAVTRITDVHLRRAAGAPAGKNYRRYLQRLARLEFHLGAGAAWLAL